MRGEGEERRISVAVSLIWGDEKELTCSHLFKEESNWHLYALMYLFFSSTKPCS